MKINVDSIEDKWIRKWRESKIFEADPKPGKPKFFITVAYPYPNSPQHIGHGRTYTIADVYARYKRMCGFNVLFPMGFHYTGTPIVAMVKRLKGGDRELRKLFVEVYGIPESVVDGFDEPVKVARYFHEEIKRGMEEMGYSIDWRREFTTIDPQYSRFIEWQFLKLRERGYVKQGSHPVGWCPSCSGPVGQHDTQGDVEPEIGTFTLLYFKLSDGTILPAATLRPETVFGAVNLWVNSSGEYVKAKVDGEYWIVSVKALEKLRLQNRSVEACEVLRGSDIVGLTALNPATGMAIPILPADFVDPTHGTGIVMSVPAHAPYDYVALMEVKAKGVDGVEQRVIDAIDIKPVIRVEGYSDIPARDVVEKYRVMDQRDPKLEDATQDVYRAEYHRGFMRDDIPIYGGLPVSEARVRISDDLRSRGLASYIYDIMNHPVYCRCGALCMVKILEDQWFIDYGDPEWKRVVHKLIDSMSIKPEVLKAEFHNVVDWLREKACARRIGLGTRLPWNPDWIIESLSDSTIYMVYYLISKYVNLYGIKPDCMKPEFFDYVILGRGDVDSVSKSTGIPRDILESIRIEIEYFYPLDSRHSGRDLVSNHLAFFLFNHVAIFDERMWPRQIVVNGSVMMEGKKMSKSLGNIIPLRSAIKEYGADALRLSLLSAASLLQDVDFKHSIALSFKAWLERFIKDAEELKSAAELDSVMDRLRVIDRWILSRLQARIDEARRALEELEVRDAVQSVIYGLDDDISWYKLRVSVDGGLDDVAKAVLKSLWKVRALLLAPLAPFTAEEVWSILGGGGMASTQIYPSPSPSLRDIVVEACEDMLRSLLSDSREILKLMKKPASRICYYLSSPYKWRVASYAAEMFKLGSIDVRGLIDKCRVDPELKGYMDRISRLASEIVREAMRLGRVKVELYSRINLDVLRRYLEDAKPFLERELKCRVEIYVEGEGDVYDPTGRASRSIPWRPAIYVE
ncbi:leucine--tRNA ligase [Candidatus Bathyarchaeota archaeon]|nr:leucine--tRNA ligase [Candidatus Bathyarchaeota archaeon]